MKREMEMATLMDDHERGASPATASCQLNLLDC